MLSTPIYVCIYSSCSEGEVWQIEYKSMTFSGQISVYFGSMRQNVLKSDLKKSRICPTCGQYDQLWGQIRNPCWGHWEGEKRFIVICFDYNWAIYELYLVVHKGRQTFSVCNRSTSCQVCIIPVGLHWYSLSPHYKVRLNYGIYLTPGFYV